MRLGKRSTRIRSGVGGQLIRLAGRLPEPGFIPAIFVVTALVAAAFVATANAQRAAPATVGPDRIVCNASFCEMGSGARAKERVRIIISNLPQDEIRRLRKCTGVSQPCIVTIDGTQQGDPMKIMASNIRWQDKG